MKSSILSASRRFRVSRLVLILAGLSALAVTTSNARAGVPAVLSPESWPYGQSYEEWSARWWQWALSQSTDHEQLVGAPMDSCNASSPVWFLEGASGEITTTRKVTVPDNVALFFPILTAWADNSGCDASNHVSFTDLAVPDLRGEVAGLWSAVSDTQCWIDGVPVTGSDNYSNSFYMVQSPAFSYTTARKDNILAGVYQETCIPGGLTIFPAVAQGIYLMVAPLAPGHHIIRWYGVVGPAPTPYFVQDITYDLTVTRGGR